MNQLKFEVLMAANRKSVVFRHVTVFNLLRDTNVSEEPAAPILYHTMTKPHGVTSLNTAIFI